MEDGFALACCLVYPIEPQPVQVDVQVGRRAKALDEGDRAGGGLGALDARLAYEVGGDDSLNHAQHRPQQFRMHGKQAAQRDGERQHPLPHRHVRDDLINQVSRRLMHAPRAARGTEAASLATERHPRLAGAGGAGEPHETVGEDAALKVGVELVGDEARQACACGLTQCDEGLRVMLSVAVQTRD